ncbi:hypothetical protein COLO4_30843 [Corchorus olitorius]|uniref:Lipase, GDSL n=1 Tax=Corchorus olitorius TaxID=93759 RepID=A0A1R3H6U5_9ROSI|nr:hypothetical protein COLO4_30843 [Corchorus olitorius]
MDQWCYIVIGNITVTIKELYRKGARKFGFVNVESLGCLPYAKLLDQGNNGFNEVKMACCGSGKYRGILNCGRGGAKDYELCENPNKYLFFDAYHLTGKASQQLAELMWSSTDPKISGPYNLKALINL